MVDTHRERHLPRISYSQIGLVHEAEERIVVRLYRHATERMPDKDFVLVMPMHLYSCFLDVLQAQTASRFRHWRAPYDRAHRVLRAFVHRYEAHGDMMGKGVGACVLLAANRMKDDFDGFY